MQKFLGLVLFQKFRDAGKYLLVRTKLELEGNLMLNLPTISPTVHCGNPESMLHSWR